MELATPLDVVKHVLGRGGGNTAVIAGQHACKLHYADGVAGDVVDLNDADLGRISGVPAFHCIGLFCRHRRFLLFVIWSVHAEIFACPGMRERSCRSWSFPPLAMGALQSEQFEVAGIIVRLRVPGITESAALVGLVRLREQVNYPDMAFWAMTLMIRNLIPPAGLPPRTGQRAAGALPIQLKDFGGRILAFAVKLRDRNECEIVGPSPLD